MSVHVHIALCISLCHRHSMHAIASIRTGSAPHICIGSPCIVRVRGTVLFHVAVICDLFRKKICQNISNHEGNSVSETNSEVQTGIQAEQFPCFRASTKGEVICILHLLLARSKDQWWRSQQHYTAHIKEKAFKDNEQDEVNVSKTSKKITSFFGKKEDTSVINAEVCFTNSFSRAQYCLKSRLHTHFIFYWPIRASKFLNFAGPNKNFTGPKKKKKNIENSYFLKMLCFSCKK